MFELLKRSHFLWWMLRSPVRKSPVCWGASSSSSVARLVSELSSSSGGLYQSPSRSGPVSVCMVVQVRSAVVELVMCVAEGASVRCKSRTPPWFVLPGAGVKLGRSDRSCSWKCMGEG